KISVICLVVRQGEGAKISMLLTTLAGGVVIGGALPLHQPSYRGLASGAGFVFPLIDSGMQAEISARLARGVHVITQGDASRFECLGQGFLDGGMQRLTARERQASGRCFRVDACLE